MTMGRELEAGALIPGTPYLVRATLARGRSSVIYEVVDRNGATRVAKVIEPNITMRAVPSRGGRIFDHSNVVGVDTFVVTNERPARTVLVMERLQGATLHRALHQRGVLRAEHALDVGEQVAAALECLHTGGMTHGALSPEKVFIAVGDERAARAKLLFSARFPHFDGGLPEYLAPEVLRGLDAGDPADIFALGAVLFESLVGRPPFSSDPSMDTEDRVRAIEAGLSFGGRGYEPLERVLRSCVAYEPRDRPRPAQLREELRQIRARLPRSEDTAPWPALRPGDTARLPTLPN
jgi:serine/threonine protein kinase